MIACGTSYHAGLIAKNLIEGWARIPTEVEAASEFRYRNPIITPTTLVVAVSQSGETADTLAAIRDARIKGAKVFGITNVVGSPVARESDGVIYTKANKEIAVASTKSFIGQVVSLTLLALLLAQVKYRLTTKQARMLFRELSDTAEQIQWILDTQTEAVHEAALLCKDAQSALFVGRGMGAAISYEGALKLKEVSYLHAEAYAAGEMKHGPIALIDPGFPVIAVATKSATYDKTVSNLMECKARGAKVIVVATEGDEEINKIADCIIRVPAVRDVFSPITASVPLQPARRRGCHPARLRRRPAPQPGKERYRGVVGSAILATKARLRCSGAGPCFICPDKTCQNEPVPIWQVSGACWSRSTRGTGPEPRSGCGTSYAGAC